MYMGSIAPSCVVPIPKNRTSHKVLRRLKVIQSTKFTDDKPHSDLTEPLNAAQPLSFK